MTRRVFWTVIALLLLLTGVAEEAAFERTMRVDDDFFFGKRNDEWRLYTSAGDVFVDYFWSTDELKENGKLPFAGFGEEQAASIRFGRGQTALVAAIDREGEIILPSFRGTLEAFQEGVARYRASGCGWGLFSAYDGVLLDSKTSDCDSLTRVQTGVWRGVAGKEERWYYLADGALRTADVIDYAAAPAIDTSDLAALELTGGVPKISCEEQLRPFTKALLRLAGAKTHSDGRVDEMTVSTCTDAYDRLIAGSCDLILVTEPLEAYAEKAEASGVTLAQREVGLDALVFLAHEDTVIANTSVEGLKAAFGVGTGESAYLLCHQKADTGARAALATWLEGADAAVTDSPLVSEGVYRNFPGALGYAYRSNLPELPETARLLSVDGVEPMEENLLSGAYPLTKTVYAVYRVGEKGWNAEALSSCLATEDGRALVKRAGLVPIGERAEDTSESTASDSEDPDEKYGETDYDTLLATAPIWSGVAVRFDGTVAQVERQDDVEYIAVDMGVTGQMRIVLLENRTWQTVPRDMGRVRVYGVTLGTAEWQGMTCPLVAAQIILAQ